MPFFTLIEIPVGPVGPVVPVGPVIPVGPVLPVKPVGPFGKYPILFQLVLFQE